MPRARRSSRPARSRPAKNDVWKEAARAVHLCLMLRRRPFLTGALLSLGIHAAIAVLLVHLPRADEQDAAPVTYEIDLAPSGGVGTHDGPQRGRAASDAD